MTHQAWDDAVELSPPRTWLLEASAGTGKTYQIATLVVRLVAEYGVAIDRILVVTFTHAATGELKDRVRRRLTAARDALQADAAPEGDPVLVRLWERPAPDRAEFARRLDRAVRAFDTAPISTIHGFSQRALDELAFDTGQDAGLELLGDKDDVVARVVDDTIALLWSELDAAGAALAREAGVTRGALVAVAKAMSGAAEPRVVPAVEGLAPSADLAATVARMAADLPGALAAFATTARWRVEREIERRRALTFDAMLSRLADRVQGPDGRPTEVAERLRERYDAVLVDEFQDTDSAQWKVMRAAFDGHSHLFLIGDPKQAIYAFRGADVHVYLSAAETVGEATHRTLTINWRSDPAAVQAMNALWRKGSHAFEQDRIDYVEVDAAEKASRVAPSGPGLDLRWLDASSVGGDVGTALAKKPYGLAARAAAREVVRLLGSGTTLAVGGEPRPLGPGDLAVLVAAHHEGAAVRRELSRVGVPSVTASAGSVLETPVATWLADWLDAVAGAGRDRAARRAVVTPLFGWTAPELAWALAAADVGRAGVEARPADVRERDWNAWTERLRDAAERWHRLGFAGVFDREASEGGIVEQLLRIAEGERHATDLRHLYELLHAEERVRRCGPGALATWLRGHAAEEAAGSDDRKQRLESDARAVKIETIHASKGLEYPVVLLPFAWNAKSTSAKPGPITVRGATGLELHFAAKGTPEREVAADAAAEEQRRESFRLLYVALTRARHRTIAWYGPLGTAGKSTSATPLGRLLMRGATRTGFDDADTLVFPTKGESDTWPVARARLDALAERSGDTIAWQTEAPPSGSPPRWVGAEGQAPDFAAARWPADRASIGSPWIVTSFSGLHGAASVDPNERLRADEPPVGEAAGAGDADADVVPLPDPPLDASVRADLPRLGLGGGKAYGTWVHAVFEHLDFTTGGEKGVATEPSAADLVERLGAPLGVWDHAAARDEIVACLPALLDTPLDAVGAGGVDVVRGLAPGFSLRRVLGADRLDEVTFDLRLGAGNAWRRAAGERPTEAEHHAGRVDPGAVYDAILGRPAAPAFVCQAWLDGQRARRSDGKALMGRIAGILTGSIDLVFRSADPATGRARYFLADYKTNRIRKSLPGHYTGAWLGWEMSRMGYPLQSLLYTLALHRHLRTRLRDYDYDADVGGYFYLFLRGMAGPDTPRDLATGRCLGVLGDRWPREVIEGLDRALDGASAEAT